MRLGQADKIKLKRISEKLEQVPVARDFIKEVQKTISAFVTSESKEKEGPPTKFAIDLTIRKSFLKLYQNEENGLVLDEPAQQQLTKALFPILIALTQFFSLNDHDEQMHLPRCPVQLRADLHNERQVFQHYHAVSLNVLAKLEHKDNHLKTPLLQ